MYFLANEFVTCMTINEIPAVLPNLVALFVNIIKIVIPIILIIFGMLDLGKAVMAGKDDDIKKGQTTFFKRAIAAIAVFLVVFIVQMLFTIVGSNTGDANISKCISCFMNGANNENCRPE